VTPDKRHCNLCGRILRFYHVVFLPRERIHAALCDNCLEAIHHYLEERKDDAGFSGS
jgi:hypothetical protein